MSTLIAFPVTHIAPICGDSPRNSVPSPRELEAIGVLVVCGVKTKNAEVAWQMGISENTVRALYRTASMKTGCKSRAELVAWYREHQRVIEMTPVEMPTRERKAA